MKYNLLAQASGKSFYIDVEHKYIRHGIMLTCTKDNYTHSITDEITEFALKKLIDKLVDQCSILCCMTCCHGNFCPTGDIDNEIFCTKDVKPQSIEELFTLLEDQDERSARVRSLFDVCPDHKPCSDEIYSYK